MKPKTIKAVLQKKLNDFTGSVEDQAIRTVIEAEAFVTGGAIASMLLGEPVNDFDIYFKTVEAAEVVATYFVRQFEASPPSRLNPRSGITVEKRPDGQGVAIHVKYDGFDPTDVDIEAEPERAVEAASEVAEPEKNSTPKRKYYPKFVSANCITLSDKIQLVTRFCGIPETIHENYDFVHCTCSYDPQNGELTLPPEALKSLLVKDLHYIGSKYPICSVVRMRKFIQRGWTITAGQILKMCWQINSLDLADFKVLEDQLVGVDTLLFMELIEKFKAYVEKKQQTEGTVDSTYLFQLIDSLF